MKATKIDFRLSKRHFTQQRERIVRIAGNHGAPGVYRLGSDVYMFSQSSHREGALSKYEPGSSHIHRTMSQKRPQFRPKDNVRVLGTGRQESSYQTEAAHSFSETKIYSRNVSSRYPRHMNIRRTVQERSFPSRYDVANASKPAGILTKYTLYLFAYAKLRRNFYF